MLSVLERVLLLKQSGLFARIPGDELARLADTAVQTAYNSGDTIVRRGEPQETLYALIEGEVLLRRIVGPAERSLPVSVLGDVGFFDGEPSDVEISALKAATVLSWERHLLFALLEDRPELARGLLAALARRLRAHETADELSARLEE